MTTKPETIKIVKAMRVAEALLPLLDVTILLLGFYIILFATGVLSFTRVVTEYTIPGIGQVILLRVEDDKQLFIQWGEGTEDVRITDVENLKESLEKIKEDLGREDSIVLVYYSKIWGLPHDFGETLTGIVRSTGSIYVACWP